MSPRQIQQLFGLSHQIIGITDALVPQNDLLSAV